MEMLQVHAKVEHHAWMRVWDASKHQDPVDLRVCVWTKLENLKRHTRLHRAMAWAVQHLQPKKQLLQLLQAFWHLHVATKGS